MKTILLMLYRSLLAAALGIAAAGPVLASPIDDPAASFDVTKKFNFAPAGGVNAASWEYLVHTIAAAPLNNCGPFANSVPLPPTRLVACHSPTPKEGNADAAASVATTALTPRNVAGQIRAFGDVSVPLDKGFALSEATSGVTVNGDRLMLNGQLVLTPKFFAFALGLASTALFDPVTFDILDSDTGLHTLGRLENIDAELNGTGSFTWADNLFTVDATDFAFNLDLGSPFIAAGERGTVDFRISGGIVTTSTATGIFAGLLPTVGSGGAFSTPFSNELTVDYDFGSLGGANPLVSIGIDDGGSARAVPEPGTLLLACTGLVLLSLTRRRLG